MDPSCDDKQFYDWMPHCAREDFKTDKMVLSSLPARIKDCYSFSWRIMDIRRTNFVVSDKAGGLRCTGSRLSLSLLPKVKCPPERTVGLKFCTP